MSPILTGVIASGITGQLNTWSPEGAYDALGTITVGSTAVSSVTFSGIPSGYKHLQVRGIVLTSGATNPTWRVNEDTSGSYYGHHLWGTGAAVASNAQSGTGVFWNYNPSASYPSVFIMDWLDYSSTTKNKTMRTFAGSDTNGGVGEVALWSGLYTRLNPISSITLDGNGVNFTQNSHFALYGVK
jgi:hypothetical protein